MALDVWPVLLARQWQHKQYTQHNASGASNILIIGMAVGYKPSHGSNCAYVLQCIVG